jgi:hypothetical protein
MIVAISPTLVKSAGQWYSGDDHHFEADLFPMKDNTSDIGSTGLSFRNLVLEGTATIGGSITPAAGAAATLGTTAAPYLATYTYGLSVEPPAVITESAQISSLLNYVSAAGGAVTLTLPDAAIADGRLICVVLVESTTADVTVKSGGGTVGKTDRSAAGAAAGTGIVFADADEDTWGCWVSNATNWDLALATLTSD